MSGPDWEDDNGCDTAYEKGLEEFCNGCNAPIEECTCDESSWLYGFNEITE